MTRHNLLTAAFYALIVTGLILAISCTTLQRQAAHDAAAETTQTVPLTPNAVQSPTSFTGWIALWGAVFLASFTRKMVTATLERKGIPPFSAPPPAPDP